MSNVELPALYIDVVSISGAAERPVIINRDPGPSDTDVPFDASVVFEVVDPGSAGIDGQHTRAWVNGVLAYDGGAAPEFVPPFDGAGSSATQSPDTLRVVLRSGVEWESQSTVVVRIVSRTADGLNPIDVSYSFEIEDRTAPRLLSARALTSGIVELQFSEAVVVGEATTFLVTAQSKPAVPVGVLEATPSGSAVTIEVRPELSPDAFYSVIVEGISDTQGNVISPSPQEATFIGFRPARPQNRRFDLWQMLPLHNRRDDLTGDLRAFVSALQDVTDLLLADVDRFANVFDVERAPSSFVDGMLEDLGNPFPWQQIGDTEKRRLASVLVAMYRQKGTAEGIRNAVRFFVRVELSLSPWGADTLTLGESELGIDWVLGPSDSFARFAFTGRVDRMLSEAERRQVRAMVDLMKPAHTHFVELIEPTPPVLPDHWEIGYSDLSDTTILH